jgi:starch phosphorylase
MFTSEKSFIRAFQSRLSSVYGKTLEESSSYDRYTVLALMVRDEVNKRWMQTNDHYLKNVHKQVYYFSLEFMIGKLLDMYLIYLGARDVCKNGLQELGIELEDLESQEPEAGLGNGGLGRLAACFLDSMATLAIPGHGCGIRYKYGLFKQKIVEGYQVELPDNWLSNENVLEVKKPDKAILVKFGGHVAQSFENGRTCYLLEDYTPVLAVPYDVPVLGYKSNTVNTLRLWSAEPVNAEFDFASFSSGDYSKAMEYKNNIQAITEVLYPDDSNYRNRELRLKQEYFLVSAGLQSIVRRLKKGKAGVRSLPDKVAVHINDTHPALAIPELMRILLDEEGLSWDEAWDITTRTVSYTNHTVLPEALEMWQEDIVRSLLPRIYMILIEINERFCRGLWSKRPGDWKWISDMSIVAGGNVNMAYLSVVGSHSVNGVSELHSTILKTDLLKNFYFITPYKFNNKTNGIAFRRWFLKANPGLSRLVSSAIGPSWTNHSLDLSQLVLDGFDKDQAFQDGFNQVKSAAKKNLAAYVKAHLDISIDPASIYDIQVKRIHGFKRQILNILNIMAAYNELRENPGMDFHPRTCIFSGKAAPSYYYAKKVIKLINTLADKINNDKSVSDKLKVIFLENYNVTLGELIFPAADISEQISIAGKEASGTGNMKSVANGAVILGTMDGANVEISRAVGAENILIFGLSAEEAASLSRSGNYSSYDLYRNDLTLKTILDQLDSSWFDTVRSDEFVDIRKSLLDYNDEYLVLKDFQSYSAARAKSGKLYGDRATWTEMAINNIAFSGTFNSDDTIQKYANDIWDVRPSIVRTFGHL